MACEVSAERCPFSQRILNRRMSRYFFHVFGGDKADHQDIIGEDLPSRQAAWEMAIRFAAVTIEPGAEVSFQIGLLGWNAGADFATDCNTPDSPSRPAKGYFGTSAVGVCCRSKGGNAMTDDIGITAAEDSDASRIRQASEAIRDMANDLKPATKGLEPVVRRITDEVCAITRQAPLQSLAIAFLLGVMIARRR